MYLRTLEQTKRYKARDEGPCFMSVTSNNTWTKKTDPSVEYPVRVISVAVV